MANTLKSSQEGLVQFGIKLSMHIIVEAAASVTAAGG